MGPFAQRPKGFVEVSPRLGEGVLNADRRGSYSLDSLFGITLPEPVTGIVAAGLAVAGVAFAWCVAPGRGACRRRARRLTLRR